MRSLAVPREMVVTLITTLRPPFMLVYKYNNFTCHKRALSDIKIAQEPVRGCFLRVAGVVVVFAWRGVVAHCPAVFAFFSNAPVKQPKQSHLTARFYKQPNSYGPRTVAWMLNSGATLHWRPNRTVLSCAWSHLSAPPAFHRRRSAIEPRLFRAPHSHPQAAHWPCLRAGAAPRPARRACRPVACCPY